METEQKNRNNLGAVGQNGVKLLKVVERSVQIVQALVGKAEIIQRLPGQQSQANGGK